MTKETFKLVFDAETKITYVRKVKDEETKNHKETNNNIVTGFMPQIIDPSTGYAHRLCPVHSFENYLAHLNPKVDKLWQQPLKRFKSAPDTIAYKAVPLGHTPLERFMSKLSLQLELSEYYTNHCIRVTGTSNLFRAHFTPKQIMSVTGHKSLQSLGIYQRVANNEKMMMGMSLMYNLLKPEEVYRVRLLKANIPQQNQPALNTAQPLQLPPPPAIQAPVQEMLPIAPPVDVIHPNRVAVQAPPAEDGTFHALDPRNNNMLSLDQALVPLNTNQDTNQDENLNPNNLGDIDFLELLNDGNDDDLVLAVNQIEKTLTTTTTKTLAMKKNSPKMPLQSTFNHCSFGNIGTLNIHIHKH